MKARGGLPFCTIAGPLALRDNASVPAAPFASCTAAAAA